jgi:hypothetical protein
MLRTLPRDWGQVYRAEVYIALKLAQQIDAPAVRPGCQGGAMAGPGPGR